jgi:hypothetical protein
VRFAMRTPWTPRRNPERADSLSSMPIRERERERMRLRGAP